MSEHYLTCVNGTLTRTPKYSTLPETVSKDTMLSFNSLEMRIMEEMGAVDDTAFEAMLGTTIFYSMTLLAYNWAPIILSYM